MYSEMCGEKSEEKDVFCGKCEHKEQQDSEENPFQGKPKKTGKKVQMIVILVVALLLIMVGAFIFLRSDSTRESMPLQAEDFLTLEFYMDLVFDGRYPMVSLW